MSVMRQMEQQKMEFSVDHTMALVCRGETLIVSFKMKKTQKGRVAAVPSVSSTLPESRLESPKVVVTRTSTHVWHKPDATFPLGMSVLSSVFCCFVCGISGILVAWKARLLVLDEKYEHARVSIRIVWLLVFLAMLSGILTWIMGLITIPYFYKTLLKT